MSQGQIRDMSRVYLQMITVKEEFLTEEKTLRAIKLGGHEAVTMWLALKGYAARKLTDGFIPDEAIDTLPGAPRAPRKALLSLFECGLRQKNGARGAGLVDKVDHGWQLHDYLDHAVSSGEEHDRRRKERERKAAYRATKSGAVPQSPRDNDGTVPGTTTGQSQGHGDGTTNGTNHGTSRVRVPAGARAPAVRARPRASQPSPAQPEEEEDPPSPGAAEPVAVTRQRPADPMAASLLGQTPRDRPDVQKVHAHWAKVVGREGAKLGLGYDDIHARIIAEAIDVYGEADCHRILSVALDDGMVNGSHDSGKTHQDVAYIFGNPSTFSRLLGAANKKLRKASTTDDDFDRMFKADAGA